VERLRGSVLSEVVEGELCSASFVLTEKKIDYQFVVRVVAAVPMQLLTANTGNDFLQI
jgi:hypothetical protein